jgi:hypothetical protein
MPITLRWLDEDAILLMECTGRLESQEFEGITDPILSHLEEASRSVHIISDWRSAENHPIRYDALGDTVKMFQHENMGWWAFIGLNPTLAFWAEVLTRVAGLRYRAFNTPEEAAQFLRDLDKVQQQASS